MGSILALVLLLGSLALAYASRRARVGTYLVLLRFPLLIGLLGVALPLVHLTPLVFLLDNLYVLDRPVQGLALGAATGWLIASQWFSARIIFLAADERLGVGFDRADLLGPPGTGALANELWLAKRGSAARRALVGQIVLALLGLPMIVVLATRCGFASALLATLGYALVIVLTELGWARRDRGLFAVIGRRVCQTVRGAPLWAIERRLRAWPELRARYRRTLYRTRWLRRGYGYRVDAGHGFVVLGLAASLILYAAAGLLLVPWRGDALASVVPPAAYLLVLLTVIGLWLPGLSFLFDLHRVPTLAIVLALLLLPRVISGGDEHFYEVSTHAPTELPDPIGAGQARLARLGPERDDTLVVVVASGGGAQAAVWTSQVLVGLSELGDEQDPWGHELVESIALVSSVSGGSIGAMYWVDAYSPAGLPDAPTLARLHARTQESMLEPMAWGLVFPDLTRAIFPPLGRAFPGIDRGYALEQAWKRRFAGQPPRLSSWSKGVGEGWRPLQIFNATAVESGCRVLFGAADMHALEFVRLGPGEPRRSAQAGQTPATDSEAWPLPGALAFPLERLDADVSTAARLSATFPYLLPAARMRAQVDEPGRERGAGCHELALGSQHLVDGGYYDNYGVVTAIQWIDRMLIADRRSAAPKIRRVIVIEIRSMTSQFERKGTAKPGWLIESLGPLLALTAVRTSSQVDRNAWNLGMLADSWCAAGVDIRSVQFAAHDVERLSWGLTSETLAELEAAWANERNAAQREALSAFVHGRSRCAGASR